MSWTHLSSTTPKARKQHSCLLCWEPILIGEIYHLRTGVSYDSFCEMKMHPECDVATAHWTDDDWESMCGERLKRGTDQEATEPLPALGLPRSAGEVG